MAKAGGREKGTPNKKTQDLFDLCEAKGINVFEGLLELCKHPNDQLRFGALKETAKYLYPQRKAIEHSTDEQKGFRIEVVDYISKDKK